MPFIVTPHQLNQRSELYHQLSAMTQAGVPIVQALEHLQRSPPSRSFRQPLGEMIHELSFGQTFTGAISNVSDWVPSFDIALLEAGETSGRLDACFKLLADYYRERAQLVREVISSMMYPLLLFHFAVLIFPVGMLTNLVWKGAVVPFVVQKACVFVPAYFAAFFIIYACQGQHGEWWRSVVEQVTRFIPIIGSARKNLALARLSAALEALIHAGVTILPAWQLASVASGSPSLRREVASWQSDLELGRTPSEALRESKVFPEFFSNLYYTGKISGQQDDTLRRLH